MSGATHTQIPVRPVLLGERRRAELIALVLVAALAAVLVAAVLAAPGGSSTVRGQYTPHMSRNPVPPIQAPADSAASSATLRDSSDGRPGR